MGVGFSIRHACLSPVSQGRSRLMWVPKVMLDYFGVNVELVRNLQSDLAATRVERDTVKTQLAVTNNTVSWLQVKVNQLEAEKAGLFEKAYGVKVPVPEIM